MYSEKKMDLPYEALIFDFDYTLGDTTRSIVESINYALARLGYPACSVEQVRSTIGFSLNVAFRMLTGVSDERKEALFFDYFQVKADECMTSDAQLFPHVDQLLRKWSKNFKLGVVSTKHRFRIVDILKKFNLQSVVHIVIGNEDVLHEKPHPEGILKAADALGVDRKRALYVGDSVVDAQAAQQAGIDFVAVLTGTTTKETFFQFPFVSILPDLNALDDLLQ